MVEFPLGQAIGSNKPSKNEVAINFVDPGQPAPEGVSPKEIDELMDVTFYVPGTVAKDTENDNEEEEEEVNADMVRHTEEEDKMDWDNNTTNRSFTISSSPSWSSAKSQPRTSFNSRKCCV